MSESMQAYRLYQCYLEGDQAAFTLLVQCCQNRLLRFLEKRLGNQHDSWDVLQNLWLKLLHKPGFQSPIAAADANKAFLGFLYRLARNEMLNFIRGEGRYRDYLAQLHPPHQALENPPLSDLSRQRQTQQLNQTLNRLPSQQRTTLHLRLHKEHTLQEVAQTMDCALGTSKAHYHAGLRKVREQLGEHYGEAA